MSAAILRDYPAAGDDALSRGETLLGGDYDLLGYRGLRLGDLPDWHADAVHGRRAPLAYWAEVPYLDPSAGDHKIIWELNRHQHWLTWGRAHALGGDRRFYRAFVAQLEHWLQANPPLIGTNWASMLELALRSLAWLWSLEMFAAAAAHEDEEPWIVDLLLALDRQLTHIEQNLSHYFSPNTHLTGEALALYVAGCALPELGASARRITLGRQVLIQEATRQVRVDGGHAELYAHYIAIRPTSICRGARRHPGGDPAASVFEQAARAQARYLRAICDDRGIRPQLGDDDGEPLFPVCGTPADDCRPTLAIAACCSAPELADRPVPEEARWLCGSRGALRTARYAALVVFRADRERLIRIENGAGDIWCSNAGPHGFLNGGHAHADALSLTLDDRRPSGADDPGTATTRWTRSSAIGFAARRCTTRSCSTAARSPSRWAPSSGSPGPPRMRRSGARRARATTAKGRTRVRATSAHPWRPGSARGRVVGPRSSPRPAMPRSFASHWHFHPAWRVTGVDPTSAADPARRHVALASTAPLSVLAPGETPLAVHSHCLRRRGASPVGPGIARADGSSHGGDLITATPAMAMGCTIEAVPVAIRPAEAGTAARSGALEGGRDGHAGREESSGLATRAGHGARGSMGTAGLQTYARVALLIDYTRSGSEAVLVNGATLRPTAGPALIALLGVNPWCDCPAWPRPCMRSRRKCGIAGLRTLVGGVPPDVAHSPSPHVRRDRHRGGR